MTASRRVNVNNIHIPRPSRIFVKPGAHAPPRFILGCPKDQMADLKARPTVDRPAFAPPGLFGRTPAGRAETRDRADKSALRLRADPRPTSAASDATPCDIDQICSAIIIAGGRGVPGGASAARRSAAALMTAKARSLAANSVGS